MNREIFKLQGEVTNISEEIHIPRTGIPDIHKRTLTIELEDGQKLFAEIRNRRLKLLKENNIEVNDLVEVGYTFEGSEKNGKRYNNIYVNSIVSIEYE